MLIFKLICLNMQTAFNYFSIFLIIFFNYNPLCAQKKDNLHLRVKTINGNDQYSYVNSKGATIIPFGKYPICYTEKFNQFAIVATPEKGIIGIDRNEKILFNVFVFDNGPDHLSDGLFRIIKNGKIGYANEKGAIVIPPQFDCAYPFEKGKAKVSKRCETRVEGEHTIWSGGEWYTIDKKGTVTSQ